jgi:hypothetical protein
MAGPRLGKGLIRYVALQLVLGGIIFADGVVWLRKFFEGG